MKLFHLGLQEFKKLVQDGKFSLNGLGLGCFAQVVPVPDEIFFIQAFNGPGVKGEKLPDL